MKKCITIFFISIFGTFYCINDSIFRPTVWNQLSLLEDSNIYNLSFGGPGSRVRSLKFNKNLFSIYDSHFMFYNEMPDMPIIKNKVPTVDAQYILGPELEQNLALYHNQSISNKSYYAAGANPMDLKRGIDKAWKNIMYFILLSIIVLTPYIVVVSGSVWIHMFVPYKSKKF